MTDIRLENQGNSDWGNVFLQHGEKEHRFPYHIPTGEIFNHDPDSLIRFKCAVLTVMTPLVSVMRSVYWLALSIFLVLTEFYRYLDGQSLSPDDQEAIYETAYDSLRALGYGALMTGTALTGIIAPHQARWRYGGYERALNRHEDGPHRDKFYVAICFQRLYTMAEDVQDMDEVDEKLTKYLDKIDAIRIAAWSCDIQDFLVLLHLRPAKT